MKYILLLIMLAVMATEAGCTATTFTKDYVDGKTTIHVGCRSDFRDTKADCEEYLKQNCVGAAIYASTYYSSGTIWLHATCKE